MTDRLPSNRVTLRTIRRWVGRAEPFAVLTCYDATIASWLWRGGVKCLLVGDTAAQVILGHDSTLPVPLAFMVEITAAVRRGAPDAFVIADMPFGSYQCGDDMAVQNAIRFLTEGSADAVKLEVTEAFAPLIDRMSRAGVPVVAHVGSLPQHVRVRGGYGSVGRTSTQAAQLVDTAKQMIQSGAAMLLVEAVPAQVSAQIVKMAAAMTAQGGQGEVPVIGCGGGPACHGHVVVLHDLLGLTRWQPPFARPLADLGQQISSVAAQWIEQVRSGNYLHTDHPYKMND